MMQRRDLKALLKAADVAAVSHLALIELNSILPVLDHELTKPHFNSASSRSFLSASARITITPRVGATLKFGATFGMKGRVRYISTSIELGSRWANRPHITRLPSLVPSR